MSRLLAGAPTGGPVVNPLDGETPAAAFPSALSVKETVLGNGLKVLTLEDRSSPVVSVQVWYRVGSRNEELGRTGLSHLLEHMMFRGTAEIGPGEHSRIVRRHGGRLNALTSEDVTVYFENLARDRLELALALEADRMVNCRITEEVFAEENQVVREERRLRVEDSPQGMAYEAMMAMAFLNHPYRWPVVGWMEDLEEIRREDLLAYYRTYYRPDNATLVMVGDLDTAEALALARKYFGPLPPGRGPVPRVRGREPLQQGERRARLRKQAELPYVCVGYHVPRIGEADELPLLLLEAILSGGRSSRFYRRMVRERQMARYAQASYAHAVADPQLFYLVLAPRPGVAPEKLEEEAYRLIGELAEGGVSPRELTRAKNQARASFLFARESVAGMAYRLGLYESLVGWRYLETFLERLERVGGEEVREVCRRYLRPENRTVAAVLPGEGETTREAGVVPMRPPGEPSSRGGADGEIKVSPPVVLGIRQVVERVPGALEISSPAAERETWANGLRLIWQEDHTLPLLTLMVLLPAGSVFDPPDQEGVAALTAGLLDRGAGARDAEELADAVEGVGGRLAAWADYDAAWIRLELPSSEEELAVGLLEDLLMHPLLAEEEFSRRRKETTASLVAVNDRPGELAYRALLRQLYGSHPYGHHPQGWLESVEGLTRREVLAFHQSHYGPRGSTIAVVGDFEVGKLRARWQKSLGKWAGGEGWGSPRPAPPQPETGLLVLVDRELTQSNVKLGLGGLSRRDPAYHAALVMNTILGGSSISSRLGDSIRNQKGLAYHVSSRLESRLGAGPWYVSLETKRESTRRAVESVREEIRLIREEPVSHTELRDARLYLVGSYPLSLETSADRAGALLASELYQLGENFAEDHLRALEKVTIGDVQQAAQDLLPTDRFALIIVGDEKEVGPAFSDLRRVPRV